MSYQMIRVAELTPPLYTDRMNLHEPRGIASLGLLIGLLLAVAIGGVAYLTTRSAVTPPVVEENRNTIPPRFDPRSLQPITDPRSEQPKMPVAGVQPGAARVDIQKINAPASVTLSSGQIAEVRNKGFYFKLDSVQVSAATIELVELSCAVQFPSDPRPTGPVCTMMPPEPEPRTLALGESVKSKLTTVTLANISDGAATFQVSSPFMLSASPPSGAAPLDITLTASLDGFDVLEFYSIQWGDGSPPGTAANGSLRGETCAGAAVLRDNRDSPVCISFIGTHRYASPGTFTAALIQVPDRCRPQLYNDASCSGAEMTAPIATTVVTVSP